MKKLSRAVWVLFLLFSSVAFGVNGNLSGTGTKMDPYVIEDRTDFIAFARLDKYWNTGVYAALDCDIELYNDYSSAVIAKDTDPAYGFQGKKYSGRLDGRGHTIFGLKIKADSSDYLGLFGYVTYDSKITNLHLEDMSCLDGGDYIGAIAGFNEGDISGCSVNGYLYGQRYIGGISGMSSSGKILDCCSSATLYGTNQTGGICGFSTNGIMSRCYSNGTVLGQTNTGGICGRMNSLSEISNCYSLSLIVGYDYTGGVCGYVNAAYIKNSFAMGHIIGYEHTGGVCARSTHSNGVTNCYWNTDFSGINTSDGGVGLTDQQMKDKSIYLNAGWDFYGEVANGEADIWCMNAYPELTWQYPSIVDLYDYMFLTRHWLEADCDPNQPCSRFDYFRDESVDISDLYVFADYWLEEQIINPEGLILFSDSFENDANTLISSWDPDSDWVITDEQSFARNSSACSKIGLLDDQVSKLFITLDTTGYDKFSFAAKISSEEDYDFAYFAIDGIKQGKPWSGELDWQEFVYDVPEGIHTFTWAYSKDFSISEGSDCVWVDAVKVYRDFVPEVIDPNDIPNDDPNILFIDSFECGLDSSVWGEPNRWDAVNDESFTGDSSVSSGVGLWNNFSSVLSLTIDTTGFEKISFARKISSEYRGDFGYFLVDGIAVSEYWSGELDWQEFVFDIEDGLHTFSWIYEKDETDSSGSDCMWIDDVKIYHEDITIPDDGKRCVTFTLDSLTNGGITDSTGDNWGRFIGDPNLVSGKVDNCLAFDGNDCVVIDTPSDQLNCEYVTMSAWVKLAELSDPDVHAPHFIINRKMTLPGSYSLFVNHNQWRTGVRSGDGVGEAAVVASSSTTTLEWTHICATYDGNALKLYINGVLESTVEFEGVIDQENPEFLAIGGYPNEQVFFNGLIDDVKIYNYAFTADDVTEMYEAYYPLKAYYDCQSAIDNTIIDQSEFANDATFIGEPNLVDGKAGKCLSFFGDEYITTDGPVVDVASPVSMFTWVSLSDPNGLRSQTIFQQEDGAVESSGRQLLYRAVDGKLGSYLGGGVTESDSVVFDSLNIWVHVGLVYDGDTVKLYADGSLVGQRDGVTAESCSGNFRIGSFKMDDYASQLDWARWRGKIDEISFYQKALSDDEIMELYRN